MLLVAPAHVVLFLVKLGEALLLVVVVVVVARERAQDGARVQGRRVGRQR